MRYTKYILVSLVLATQLYSQSDLNITQNITNEQNSTASNIQQEAQFTQEQLDQALAPVALYPDSLLAQLLMASTYPNQVLEAAKWSKENSKLKGDEAIKAVKDKPWNASVASLVAFPQVLEMMQSNPEWVKQLGEMFLADPDAVMQTIQNLRHKAKEAGNLKNTDKQKVVVKNTNEGSSATATGGNNTTIIEIQPASPETVYVPVYNPTVVYGSWWYPSHPPYYWHPPHITPVGAIIGFGAAVAITHALWSHWDWHRRDININVNRYNNIHINRRLDARSNKASWRRDVRVRNPRYNSIVNNRNIRTRDIKRQRAVDTLQKRGVDVNRARKDLIQNRDKIKNRVDRENLKNRIDRGNLRDMPNKDALRDRANRLDKKDFDRAKATQKLKDRGVNLDKRKDLQTNRKDISKKIDRANKRVARDRKIPKKSINRTPRVTKPTRNIKRSRPSSRPAKISRPARVNRPAARPSRPDGGLRGR